MTGEHARLVIIGAGPAGIAAALAAAREGMDVLVLDEQARVGGQITRQPPGEFRVSGWLKGRAYRAPKRLIADVEASQSIRRLHGVTVWGIFPGLDASARFEVMATRDGQGMRIRAHQVLVATGCYEMPVAFPGWSLPGVMGVGAVQTLFKSQQILPDQPIVLVGSHPLMLVLAAQLADAGRAASAVVFAQPWGALFRIASAPLAAWHGRDAFVEAARALHTIRRAGTKVIFGALPKAAQGKSHVEQVTLQHRDGRTENLPCSTLATCFGFLPSSELARQAGATERRLENGEWVIETDQHMRTSIAGLFAAGEVRGVAGAEVAAAEGELAGLAAVIDNGGNTDRLHSRIKGLQRTAARRRIFADELRHQTTVSNADLVSLLGPDTIVCRCEVVTAGEIDEVLASNPTADSANAIKLLSRTGMGLCQGRMCEQTVSRLLAQARGTPWPQPQGYAVRAPVKPVHIGALLAERGLGTIDPTVIESRHAALQEGGE